MQPIELLGLTATPERSDSEPILHWFGDRIAAELRLWDAPGKAFCTVLDFVGTHRREFRFDRRLRALLGGTRREIERAVETGFPFLPAGCHLQLDAKSSEIVLRSLRTAIPSRWPAKLEELRLLHQAAIELVWRHPQVRAELVELFDLLDDGIDRRPLPHHPLPGLCHLTPADPLGEPVHHPGEQPHRPVVPQPGAGRRSILLFARHHNTERAFWFLGPGTYRGHVGEKPMAITWELYHPLPGDLFASFAAAVA